MKWLARAGLALVATSLVLALASVASAGPFALGFRQATAKPGQTVVAVGVIVWPNANQYTASVVAYLIPTHLGHADYNTGWSVLPAPGARGTYRLGHMSVRNKRLYLRFKMPHVRPGNYMTAFWCLPHTSCGDVGTFYASALWGAPWTGKPGFVIRVTH